MTIDLNLLHSMRDLQLAMEVSERAELGWFDVEFIIHGCAFWERGARYYRLSAEAEKIYSFIEDGSRLNTFASTMTTITRRYPVPAGMREAVARDVKKELARELAEKYPVAFWKELEAFSAGVTEETALAFLNAEWETVQYTFDFERLRAFQTLLDDATLRRKISAEARKNFLALIAEERRSMEDETPAKDVFEKTFYGTSYFSGETEKFFINARKGNVYQKQRELEAQGVYTSPIVSRTYTYSRDVKTPEVRERFKSYLKTVMTPQKLKALGEIFMHNNRVPRTQFEEKLAAVGANYGEAAAETFLHYGRRWGIYW